MPIAIAALIGLLYVVVITGVPDDTGVVSLGAIVITALVIAGSAMTYSRLGSGASTRFLGSLAATSVLFVIGMILLTTLDLASPVLALVIAAPLVVTTVGDALSRRTSGQ